MKVSIIIPVLNDAVLLARCLEALAQADGFAQCEVLVVDGGPSDDCRQTAERYCATYLTSARGRAAQMNTGARLRQSEWLWFLHADCVPHRDSLRAIAALGADAFWGCFRHRIDHRSALLRIIECADNVRARWTGLPYGDQGIFVRTNVFESCYGFPEVPFLEDVMLARTLRSRGRARVLDPLLRCDARRWLAQGIARTTLMNWQIMFGYLFLKRTPEQLFETYCKKRAVSLPQD